MEPAIDSNQSKQLTEPSKSGLQNFGAAAPIEGYFFVCQERDGQGGAHPDDRGVN